MSEPEGAERREHPRVGDSTIAMVLARHNSGVAFTIENISLGGARLTGPLTLEVGESIRLLFELEGHPIDVEGEVVRVDRQDIVTDRVAVAFKGLSDANRDAIRRLVRAALDLECERIEHEE